RHTRCLSDWSSDVCSSDLLEGGTAALIDDAPGRGRPKQIAAAKVKKIVETTLHTTPKAATHWSVRTMAQLHGVSPATVQRIWDRSEERRVGKEGRDRGAAR